LTLAHPDPVPIIESAIAEIARLEAVFSLYDTASALSRLNSEGRLDHPPVELLDCLSLCATVHAATDGLFDPTIQPLWAAYAEHHSRGRSPSDAAIAEACHLVGWSNVTYDTAAVSLAKPGMALTLNGVAQGYIADRVARLLRERGLTDILVNTGEYRALGGRPGGGGWLIGLVTPNGQRTATIELSQAALATSSAHGTTFDERGSVGHILDPGTGRPAVPTRRVVSVKARDAALADALSTAMCLMTRAQIDRALAHFAGAELAHLAT
jgi:thiamine biosynthesis lipoprotein